MKDKINKILQLSPYLLNSFWNRLEPESIPKGKYYIKEGQYSKKLALITKGAVYSFYSKEGEEIIEGFCFEGCFFTDYPSFINGIPSKKNFKAIEDTELLVISKEKLDGLYQANPSYERAGRLMAEYLFTSWEMKLRDSIFSSPTERYLQLAANRKDITQRIPQYLIASYLNITPQYLSQIRKKLAENE